MSEHDEYTPTGPAEGWSVYKRLIIRMIEDSARDIRELRDGLTPLRTEHDALEKTVRDLNNRIMDLQNRVQALEIRPPTGRVEKRLVGTTFSGLLIEIWKHPVGKVVAGLWGLAALLAAAAAYTSLTGRDVDINQMIP